MAAPSGADTEFLHGEISRGEAERAIATAAGHDGTFLVRKKGEIFVLSVCAGGTTKHHLLQPPRCPGGSFQLGGKPMERAGATLVEVVEHLSREGDRTVLKQNLGSAVEPSRTGSSAGRRTSTSSQRVQSGGAGASGGGISRGTRKGSIYDGFGGGAHSDISNA